MKQLEAFRRDDFDTAFTFASSTIRAQFDRSSFETMVRRGYPEIARSTFGAVVKTELPAEGLAYVTVKIRPSNGQSVEALYELTWRIDDGVDHPLRGAVACGQPAAAGPQRPQHAGSHPDEARHPGPAGEAPRPHPDRGGHLVPGLLRAQRGQRPGQPPDPRGAGGDHYVLNGQKVWTSMAHVAAWGFFLVRTDPTLAKHKGITFLLLDMKSPGLTIRPLRQITGEAEFNEVFLENVRVPATNVVGKVNEGWGVALTTLAYERDVLTMIRHISLRTALHKLLALAKRTMKNGRPASEDPVVRQKIAALSIGERVLQLNGYRGPTKIRRARPPGP